MDALLNAVAASLSAAGFPSSYSDYRLKVLTVTYRVTRYSRSLYLDGWRVARPNTSTAVNRIVGWVLLTLTDKLKVLSDEERARTRRAQFERAAPMLSAAGFSHNPGFDLCRLSSLMVLLVRTPFFVKAAPFIKDVADGDTYSALILADMIEDEYPEHLELATMLRSAFGD